MVEKKIEYPKAYFGTIKDVSDSGYEANIKVLKAIGNFPAKFSFEIHTDKVPGEIRSIRTDDTRIVEQLLEDIMAAQGYLMAITGYFDDIDTGPLSPEARNQRIEDYFKKLNARLKYAFIHGVMKHITEKMSEV